MVENNPWGLYDRLIEAIPEGIAVTDKVMGDNWTFVNAECGAGISHNVTYGSCVRTCENIDDLDLKGLACLVKSWNFEEATFGIAALNAWYSQPDKICALGGQIDESAEGGSKAKNPFDSLKPLYAGKRVAVIGHFPNVEAMADVCQLTVLERVCNSPLDTPDGACEYLLPKQDFVFMTGTTFTNKTAVRLLQLAHDAFTVVTGPSSLPCQELIDAGANAIGGSAVVDPIAAREAIAEGNKPLWRSGIKKFYWEP
ncbi:MAG: hypothetical protein IJH04_02880 [Eggerthellaceae bacterium]|nr:hypothetical protein [Eggerthellaceae bacterium]